MRRKTLPLLLLFLAGLTTPCLATNYYGIGGTLLIPISEPEIRGVGNELSVHYTSIRKKIGISLQISRSSFPLEKDKVVKSLGYYSMEEETSWSFSGSYEVAEAALSLMLFGGDVTKEEFVPVLIGGLGYGSLRMTRNLKLIDDITGNVLEDASGDANRNFATFHVGGGMMMQIHKKIHVLLAVVYREFHTNDRPIDMQFQLGFYF